MSPAALRKAWPKVQKQLEVGDILLSHSRRGTISRMIRNGTNSYWNHSALVFKTDEVIIVGCPLVVEATYGGIEVHQISEYTDNFDKYDIGILRSATLTKEERKELTKSFILNNLDVSYDYSRLFGHYFGRALGKISVPLQVQVQKWTTSSDQFLCSTFVHKALHGVHDELHDVPDDDPLDDFLHSEEMYTPRDLARDPKLKWIFNKHV